MLILLFTVFFGMQVDLFVGMAVGYLYICGHLRRFELSTQKAKAIETKFPFKYFNNKPGILSHFKYNPLNFRVRDC